MARPTPIERIRNIGVLAPGGVGKTTVSEKILHSTDHANANVSESEGIHDLTSSAATTVYWRAHQINWIETAPNQRVDDAQRSLRVIDGGIAIFDATTGVPPLSETIWHQADHFAVPRVVFVNKMDCAGANFWRTIDSIVDRLGAHPVAIQLPITDKAKFRGVIDLINNEALIYSDKNDTPQESRDIPKEMQEQVTEARDHLTALIANTDKTLGEKYLDSQAIRAEELQAALRRATIAGKLVPVLCGAAVSNKGIHSLLGAVVDYLPSPLNVPPIGGISPDDRTKLSRRADDNEPLAALVFKTLTDPYVGQLACVRVYSGRLTANTTVLNATRNQSIRIGPLLRLYTNSRHELSAIYAGDIAAINNPENISVGDTLCDPFEPILLEELKTPAIEIPIDAETEPQPAWEEEAITEPLPFAEPNRADDISEGMISTPILIERVSASQLDVVDDHSLSTTHTETKNGQLKKISLIAAVLVVIACLGSGVTWAYLSATRKPTPSPTALVLASVTPTPREQTPSVIATNIIFPTPIPAASTTRTPTFAPPDIANSPNILWGATMETGDLGQWYLPDSMGGPNTGGGIYNKGPVKVTVTDQIAHSGRYAIEMSIENGKGVSQAVRLFRWRENPRAAYYSVWYLFPKNYKPVKFWNVMQFVDPKGATWILNVGNRPSGEMYFYLYDGEHNKSYEQTAANIPVGRWTHVEVFYQRETTATGRIAVWLDDTLLFDLDGIQTSTSNQVRLSVNNYSDIISPSPATIYVDDVIISTTRIEQ